MNISYEVPTLENLGANPLEVERQKLLIEEQKLKIEKRKVIWTSLSIFVPLFAATITLAVGWYNEHLRQQREFENKAAEIILASPDPETLYAKAQILLELFPEEYLLAFVSNS